MVIVRIAADWISVISNAVSIVIIRDDSRWQYQSSFYN